MTEEGRQNAIAVISIAASAINPFAGAAVAIGASYFFPPEQEKLDNPFQELNVSLADSKVPVTEILGTVKVQGNYIFKGKLIAISKKKQSGSTGGKGGPNPGNIKYQMDALIDIGVGTSYVSRCWANNEIVVFRGLSTVAFYEGTPDQAVDPMFSAEVDNPVPYQGLNYISFNNHPLQETNVPPTYGFEVHKYPFVSTAGSHSRTYRHRADAGGIGLIAIASDGKIWAMNEGDSAFNYLRRYNADMTAVEVDVDLTVLSGSFTMVHLWDTYVVETAGRRFLFALFEEDKSGNKMKLMRFDLDAIVSDTLLGFTFQTVTVDAAGGKYQSGCLFSDDENLYIGVSIFGGDRKLFKYTFGLVEVSETDVSALITAGPFGMTMAYGNQESTAKKYFISVDVQRIRSFDVATMTQQNTINITASNKQSRNHLDFMRGGDEFVIGGGDPASPSETDLFIYGINFDTGVMSLRKQLDLYDTAYWGGTLPSANLIGEAGDIEERPKAVWGMDGTVLISYRICIAGDFSTVKFTYAGVQILETSLNIAQAVYYLCVTSNDDLTSADIETTSLKDLSVFCQENQLGMSDPLRTIGSAFERAQQYVNGIQCKMYTDDEGKIAFSVVRDSDSSIVTITKDDLNVDLDKGEFEWIRADMSGKYTLPNRLDVFYINRSNQYKKESFSRNNFLGQNKDLRATVQSASYHWMPSRNMVADIAERLLKRLQYGDTSYDLPLLPKFMYLNPGDLINVNISEVNLVDQLMRVQMIDEPPFEAGKMTRGPVVHCVKDKAFMNTFDDIEVPVNLSKPNNIPPAIPVLGFVFEQDAIYNGDFYTICVAAVRYNADTAGCQIWISDDGSEFRKLDEELTIFAVQGTVETSIDAEAPEVQVNTGDFPDTFPEFTLTEQRNNNSYCAVGELQDGEATITPLEFMTYRGTRDAGGDIILEDLFRGKDYTLPKAHGTDAQVFLVGRTRYQPVRIDSVQVGKTLFLKLVPYNSKGVALEESEITAIEYNVQGLTRKATHTAGLELYENGAGLRSLEVINSNDATTQWLKTNRSAGPSSKSASGYEGFVEGDATSWDLLIYDSGLSLVATRLDIQDDGANFTEDSDGIHLRYNYTEAFNTADFAGLTKDLYLSIRPKNGNGFMVEGDTVKKHVIINT